MHGGTIEVRSSGKGTGATFLVTLPVATMPQISEQPLFNRRVVEPALDHPNILVVDDAPDTLELVTTILEAAGASVENASSGHAGLEAIRRTKPEVLISDLGMPGMDGIEFLRNVHEEFGEIPAIAVSAFTTMQIMTETRAAGFRAHLAKPIVVTELLQAVADATKESRGKTQKPSRSVLVVEDDRTIAAELGELLRDRGFAVHTVHDGANAWSLLQDGYRPSVILLDLMMPVMDGRTFRSKLLEEEELAAVPVVLVTGSPMSDIRDIERVEAVVRKPFDVRLLLNAIDLTGAAMRGADAR